MLTILRADPRWTGRIRLDRFRDAILVDGDGINDRDLTHIACWAEEVYDLNPSKDLMVECLSAVAAENGYPPGARLGDHADLGRRRSAPVDADDVLRRARRQADSGDVARLARRRRSAGAKAGRKLDTVLVLAGEQGVGKSSACKALMPNPSFFADTPLDLRSKDCMQNLGVAVRAR